MNSITILVILSYIIIALLIIVVVVSLQLYLYVRKAPLSLRHTLLLLIRALRRGSGDQERTRMVLDAELEKDGLIHVVVANTPEAAGRAIKDIKIWLRNADEIDICDPYIMSPPKSGFYDSDENYINRVISLIPPESKRINLYGNYASLRRIQQPMTQKMRRGRPNRQFNYFYTDTIHDRYIIKDKRWGKMIGTSFGGIGNKFFTILDLPAEDVQSICGELERIRETGGSP
jgi:hypothetical protein